MKIGELITDLLKLQNMYGGNVDVVVGLTTTITQDNNYVKIEGFATDLVSSKFVDGDGLILSMEWRK